MNRRAVRHRVGQQRPASGVRKVPRSVPSASSSAFGPATRVRSANTSSFCPGRRLVARASVGGAQRPGRGRSARGAARISARDLEDAELPGGCAAGSGSAARRRRAATRRPARRRRIRSSSSVIACTSSGLTSSQQVERAQVEVGQRDVVRAGGAPPTGSVQVTVAPTLGRRRAARSRASASRAGSATARGVAPAGAVRPGRRWTATRWVSPMPAAGVWTTSGSGGKVAAA